METSKDCQHHWKQTYYGDECADCGLFLPDADLSDSEDDAMDVIYEEEYEPSMDCHGGFDRGTFWCGKAGSEECDFECAYSGWIRLTRKQIDKGEDESAGAIASPTDHAEPMESQASGSLKRKRP